MTVFQRKKDFTMFKFILAFGVAVILGGCVASSSRESKLDKVQSFSVPIHFIQHAIVVPVRINGTIDSNFILDTGIGMSLISKSLCDKVHCKISGNYTGKRMSGQEVSVSLSSLASLTLGSFRRKNSRVGVFPDSFNTGDDFTKIDGFISLEFFENVPFTINYKERVLTIEDATSLAARKRNGRSMQLEIVRDQGTVGALLSMDVPNGPPAKMEVDTGSGAFILNEPYMSRLGINPKDSSVERLEGKDETNQPYTRYVSNISGSLFPVGAKEMAVENPKVIFQKIIYDGLVGDAFFKNFIVTYDIPDSQMTLAKP
jgi:hypothetical protein